MLLAFINRLPHMRTDQKSKRTTILLLILTLRLLRLILIKKTEKCLLVTVTRFPRICFILDRRVRRET
jgi:hypothetical protein